jgi:hypothetical protein
MKSIISYSRYYMLKKFIEKILIKQNKNTLKLVFLIIEYEHEHEH